jgi:dihydroorotate dehydrogenase electron transfer subunit
MMEAAFRICERDGIACQVSLEGPMACGFGVCLGCVVPCHTEDGGTRYERVCVEGPILPAERLAW